MISKTTPSTNAFPNPQNSARISTSVQLIVTNLESTVSLQEWRRILIVHFKSIAKNPFQVQVCRQQDANPYALVKLASIEDAQQAISQLNRRKIGYRRIRVAYSNSAEQGDRFNQRHFSTNPSANQRYSHSQRWYSAKNQADNFSQFQRRRDDRKNFISTTRIQNPTLPKLDDPICPKHQPKDPRESLRMTSQQNIPSVCISLADLRPNVVQLLKDHGNLISVLSFTHCYEATFGALKRENDAKRQDDQSKEVFVPLEHLITCVPDVSIQTTTNGFRVVTLTQNTQSDGATNAQETESTAAPAYGDLVEADATNSLSVVSESLRQFRREVVELVKQSGGGGLPLSRFVPSYHTHFGRQCRVADYGFTRLQDLLNALRGVVHLVGEGQRRIVMLTHSIQVRRFTHDLLRMLKNEQKKALPVEEIPQIYERVFQKPFESANYGVCTLHDLLNDLPESKLVVESLVEGENDSERRREYVVVPKRVQTAEQSARTQLFALEALEMLSTAQRFRCAFTKFIPAYHHAFNRQCRVAEYGFTKFIELLEAIPHVVEVQEENGERYIILTQQLRLSLVRNMLLELLECQIPHRMSLNDAVNTFLTQYQQIILPQDYGFETMEDMFTSFPEVLLLHEQHQPQSDDKETSEEKPAENEAYLCLLDNFKTKQTAYRCLQILFNSPFGSVPEDEFKMHYRVNFNEEVDLGLVDDEMNPFISVRDYNLQGQDQPANEVNAGETNFTGSNSRMVHLCPLILFARQLRFLLMRTRGRLMLNLLEQVYKRHFGVSLCPEAYGYPSLLTLVNAVNFAVTVKGRGSRAILFLTQDYLGKLTWMITHKILFRHDLLLQTTGENKETAQSIIFGKEYLPPVNTSIQTHQNPIFPMAWSYSGMMPIANGFIQQQQPLDFTQPPQTTYYMSNPIYQGNFVYGAQADCQEGPPLIGYPPIQPPMLEMPKMAPTTYAPFYMPSGETWAQPTPPIWAPQPTNQGFAGLAPIGYVGNYFKSQSDAEEQQQQTESDKTDVEATTEAAFIVDNTNPSCDLLSSSWCSMGPQQTWAPALIYHNSQSLLTDGQGETWTTANVAPWTTNYGVATAWPMLQSTPVGIPPTGLPVFDATSAFTLTPNPFRGTEMDAVEPSGISPSGNKCEEGDWTLPISITTESIDTNQKDNEDDSGCIG